MAGLVDIGADAANNAEIDQDQQLVIYRGEVQVDQGSLRVIADEMRVEYRDQKVVKIIATGAPACVSRVLHA